ncbi:hypothetical protein HF086_017949 [Spodoptera exigua]|uniref:Uncharacterized protein n=1 Tax=Spodoptera exigua TaxID=7107 RepID=A0A922M0D5_SPOEX|nr:hypothetical protein HF086_017949 [Spodoptera exigua]
MAKQDDGLFLLEVLIDKIVFVKSPCFSDKDFRTCVTIETPSVQPLEICDDDPGACVAKSGGPFVKTFNSGKSCLFSLQEADITKAMSSFPIKVSVFKSLPCGCLPTKIIMGEATIDMTKEFVQSRKTFLEDPTNVSYQALKDSFRIVGPDGTETGEVVMFLRISCFGKLIITRFQGTSAPPKLGGSRGPSIVDRSCNPKREFQTSQDPCVCGAAQAAASSRAQSSVPCTAPCRTPGGSGRGVCPIAQDPYSTMPCEDPDDPCFCSGSKPPPKPPMMCRNTEQYCLHIPKGPSKQFEEIGSNLGGNELKIKVPVSASVIKKISQTHCSMQCPYDKKSSDQGPCVPPCGKNNISLALPAEPICCLGMRPQETQFSCTTEGCIQTTKHGQQALYGRGDTKNEYPNKDVFVLKVAKTAMQGDKKCKLELELVAPKGPDKKLPVGKANARIATDPECECCCRRMKNPKGTKKKR